MPGSEDLRLHVFAGDADQAFAAIAGIVFFPERSGVGPAFLEVAEVFQGDGAGGAAIDAGAAVDAVLVGILVFGSGGFHFAVEDHRGEDAAAA